jgi:hypothetical protein
LFLHERQSAWLQGLEGAFRHFGGMPHELLLDNAKALVDEHNVQTREVSRAQLAVTEELIGITTHRFVLPPYPSAYSAGWPRAGQSSLTAQCRTPRRRVATASHPGAT